MRLLEFPLAAQVGFLRLPPQERVQGGLRGALVGLLAGRFLALDFPLGDLGDGFLVLPVHLLLFEQGARQVGGVLEPRTPLLLVRQKETKHTSKLYILCLFFLAPLPERATEILIH